MSEKEIILELQEIIEKNKRLMKMIEEKKRLMEQFKILEDKDIEFDVLKALNTDLDDDIEMG